MASHSSRPRLTSGLPRPTRGQVVWWVVGGVVAVAAFAAAAAAAGHGGAGSQSSGAGPADLHPATLDLAVSDEVVLAA